VSERRQPGALVLESVRTALALRVQSLTVLLLALAVPLTSLMLAGDNLESQRRLVDSIDSEGARVVTISAAEGSLLPADALERARGVAGVVWIVGLGAVDDVSPVGIEANRAPMRQIVSFGAPVSFVSLSEPPGAGAYVSKTSATRLGLAAAAGELQGSSSVALAGWFTAKQPLTSLEPFVLQLVPAGTLVPLERMVALASSSESVSVVVSGILSTLGSTAALQARVERGDELIRAQELVSSEAAARGRRLVAALLAGATASAALVVGAGLLAIRRDFGRRRVLGATRTQLTTLTLLQTLWPALVGALSGTVAGWILLRERLDVHPDPTFPAAVLVLTVYAVLAGAVVPAVWSARRDPLLAVRVA
jgi:putative ABC transport system permease protein